MSNTIEFQEKKEQKLKVPKMFYYGTGKRKTAIAKVWLFPGKGNIQINQQTLLQYFKTDLRVDISKSPLIKLNLADKYDAVISTLGGGLVAQVDAVKLGFARALLTLNEGFKPELKHFGFLTRDPREKERKKYGNKRARKGKQYRKR